MSNVVNNSPPPPRPIRRKTSILPKIAIGLVFVLICCIAFVVGKMLQLLRPQAGEHSGGGPVSIADAAKGIFQIATDPRAGFPGMSRVNILCMGIDDNWTDKDEVYTGGARTDTLFLVSLDLDNKQAYVLSIPRDSFVPIAGTNYSDKINSAYASGGPHRSEATVADYFGVQPDYYVVLRIDATKKMVDSLGGVDVDVEHDMNYDDNWGHLHVHLTPGEQHLNGDQAVGFARYRHGNHGLTPEDGDPRRIYRQHVLLRAMMDRAKTFSNVVQVDSLIDTAMSCVDTDLSRTQLGDLAAIFRGMPQDDLQTAQLDGTDFKGPHGAADTKLDDQKAKLYVNWMIRGDESAARALTPVVVENGTKITGIAAKAEEDLRSDGYSDIRVSSTAQMPTPRTDIIDSGVPFKLSGQDIASLLGDPSATVMLKPVQPNHVGWTPPAAVTVILGSDYANSVQTASGSLNGPSVSTAP